MRKAAQIAGGAAFWHSGCKSGRFGAKPRCWRSEQTRERASCGTRSAARVGAIAIQRVVHRKASAPPACAQSRASAGGAAFWHSAANRGDLGPNPAAGEAGSFDYGPAAARGRQRALVRLRFSVWCIERHRRRRLVRKATQAKAGPLSGTRLRAGVIWGPGKKAPPFLTGKNTLLQSRAGSVKIPQPSVWGALSGASRNWRKEPHVGGTWGLLRSPYFTLCCVRVATTHTHTHSKSGRVEKSG